MSLIRSTVRPIPIAVFGEQILEIYKKKSPSAYFTVGRIVRFFTQYPEVKTTADLATVPISEFVATLNHISQSTINTNISYFRAICQIAVNAGSLKQNPLEDYKLPPRHTKVPKERRLDVVEIRSILAYLKARADTWKGHRLYVFTAVVIYTGLQSSEVLELTLADCDLSRGQIHVARRKKLRRSSYPQDVPIRPELSVILNAWLPQRKKVKRKRTLGTVRYGMRLADDRETVIEDEAQQQVIADMRRMKSEGWSSEKIAGELNARGVATKFGRAKWERHIVTRILERDTQPDGEDVSTADDGHDREPSGSDDNNDWIFPNISGTGHWHRTAGDDSALELLRAVGDALGIERLTTERLRMFHRERLRTFLDFPEDSQEVDKPHRPKSRHAERDDLCVRLREQGVSYGEIMRQVNQREEWVHLATKQAVRDAIERRCRALEKEKSSPPNAG
jgi:site-specific recombinase XerC